MRSSSRLSWLPSTAALVASTTLWIPVGYLMVLTAAGATAPRSRVPAPGPATTRFAILVPAHNEQSGIGATLDSLAGLDYPADLYSVHVVADNCSDGTAGIVRRTPWRVHERFAPDAPGKGPALNWLYDRLRACGEEFDAVVILDADSSLDAQFLREMDAAVRGGVKAAQGQYSVREPAASPSSSLRYAALASRHHLRPLGRCRLGASCGLYGNGMMLERSLLEQRRWSSHLAEDAEMQNELLLDGQLVTYVAAAVLWAEMPHGLAQATSQNERWERGRIDLARRYVPRLLHELTTTNGRRAALGDAVLDHLVPPLSVLVAAQLAVAGIGAVGAASGRRSSQITFVTSAFGIMAVISHVLIGLRTVGASRQHYRALTSAPKMIAWKLALWVRAIAGHEENPAWVRTSRNQEYL